MRFVVLTVASSSPSLIGPTELEWPWIRCNMRWRRTSGETCAASFGFVSALSFFVLISVSHVVAAAAPWMQSNMRFRRSSGETASAADVVGVLSLLHEEVPPQQLLRRRIVVVDISVVDMDGRRLSANRFDGHQCRIDTN